MSPQLARLASRADAIETITVFGTSGCTAPGGATNLQLGAGVTLVWIVGLIVWAARELGERARR